MADQAIPTTDTISGNVNDNYLLMVLNPQSNTPLMQGYGNVRTHMRTGLVSSLSLTGTTLTVTRESAANQSITLPSTNGGSVSFGNAIGADTQSGSGGSASTAARSDHRHSDSNLYANASHGTHLPAGGTANQHLAKNSANNGYAWVNPPSGGDGGDTTVGGMALTEVGSASSIGATADDITTDGTNGLTRANVEDTFLVDLEYTRSPNDNLRMSALIRKADLTGTTAYRLQVQGAGADYVEFAFDAAGDDGVLTATDDAGSVSNIDVTIYNIVGTTVTAGSGTGVLSGTRAPVAGDGDNGNYWLEGDSGGRYIAFWEKVAGTWVQIGEARDNPTYGLTADDVSAIQHLPIVPTYTPSTRVAVAVFDWNNPPTTGVSSFTYATSVTKRASVGQLMYLRVPIGDIDDFAVLRGRASVSHRGLDEGFQHLAADDTASYRYYEPHRIEGYNSGSDTTYTWDEYSAETDIDVDHLDDDVTARLLPTGGTANQHLAKNAANNGFVWVNPPSGGGSVSFGNATTRDSTSGSGGSASTVARSDHSHARSSLYAQAAHTHSNSISRIPTASPGNNKFWGTNGSGTDAWYDQSSLGGGGITVTRVLPSNLQDEVRNDRPANTVFRSGTTSANEAKGKVKAISSPSEGDIAWYSRYFNAAGDRIVAFVYTGSVWVDISNQTIPVNTTGVDDGGGVPVEAPQPFSLSTVFPQWQLVYNGPSIYQKQTDTSDDDAQPNLADRIAWEKIWPSDIPELIEPSYQGDTDWLTPHTHFPREITRTLDDVTGVYNGQALAVEIEADLPDTHIGNVTFTAEKASGGSVSNSPTLLNGKHFYLLNITYTTVPDLDISPLAIVANATLDGTYRIKVLSAYHLDSHIDDQSWEMYKLNLDTLEERAIHLEDQNPYKGQWGNRVQYRIGDMVRNGDHPTLYVRRTDMPAPPTTDQAGPRGNRTDWIPISDYMGEWQSGMYLSPGNIVSRDTEGTFKLYMVTAEIALGTTAPEDSIVFKRIDRELINWSEIQDKPAVRNNYTSPDGDQIIYLTGSDNAHTDEDRRATLSLAVGTTNGTVTPGERSKLQNIEAGAQVNVYSDWHAANGEAGHILNKPALAPSNAEPNVKSNWTETDTNSDAYIWNKPTVPTLRTAQQTARLLETLAGTNRLDYESLKNKPTINSGDVNVNADWSVTDTESDGYIRNKPNINRWAQEGRSPLDSEWTVGRQYYAGEIVGHFSHIYTTNTDHVATDQNGPRGQNSVWHSRLELRVETSLGPVLGSVTSPSSDDDLQTLSLNGWMYDRGTYNNTHTYYKQNIVERNGIQYIAKRQTLGNPPESSADDWKQFSMTPAATGVQTTGNHSLIAVANSNWLRVGTMLTTDIPTGKLFSIEMIDEAIGRPQLLELQCWLGNDVILEITPTVTARVEGWPALVNQWGHNIDEPTRYPIRLGRVGDDLYIYNNSPFIGTSYRLRFDWLP